MRSTATWTIALIVGSITLVGCANRGAQNPGISTQMPGTPTSHQIEVVIEATSTVSPAPTTSPVGANETAQAEAAPPYEEIRSRIRSIMLQFTPNPNARDIEEP